MSGFMAPFPSGLANKKQVLDVQQNCHPKTQLPQARPSAQPSKTVPPCQRASLALARPPAAQGAIQSVLWRSLECMRYDGLIRRPLLLKGGGAREGWLQHKSKVG